jgi:hypothetical protein
MVKIGILTYHFVNNCGAILQCIALQHTLSQMPDVDVEVINYQPQYHTNMYRPVINPFLQAGALVKSLEDRSIGYRAYRYVRNIASSCAKNLHVIRRYKIRKIFEVYFNKNMRLSELYKNSSELSGADDYDLYVVGSDQLWNSHITNYAADPAYYLDFVKNDASRRITYAVSGNLQEKEIPQLRSLLNKFDAISAREEKTYTQLSDILEGKNIRMDLDPTMLLTKEDYGGLEEEFQLPQDYILFYGLASRDSKPLEEAAEKLALQMNMPVVDISPVNHRLKIKTVKKNYYSPGQFLTAIKGAKYVVTNSFHGTVFSIIYNRSFYTALPTLHPERLEYLLGKLELRSRIVEPNLSFDQRIDWNLINGLLESARQESKEYLYTEVEKARNT